VIKFRYALLVLIAMLAPVRVSLAQKASNWRVYKLSDRLAESACISVTLSPQGKVLVRHFALPVLSELDGYVVRSIPSPEVGRSRVYQSPGGQLWAVVPEGLQEFKDGSWLLHRVAALENETRGGAARVIDPVPLWPVRQGLVLLLLPGQLLEYNSEDPDHPQTKVLRQAGRTSIESFISLAPSRDGGLWIGGGKGLAKVPGPIRNLKPESEWQEYLLPNSWHVRNLQGLHEDGEGGVSAVAESSTNQQRFVVYFDGRDWGLLQAAGEKLRQTWRSPDRLRWAMSSETLFEEDDTRAELVENDEIGARAYFDVAMQPGGTFWLATSDGLYRYAPPLWRSPARVKRINSPVDCVTGDATGRIWFVAGNRLCELQAEELKEFPLKPEISRDIRPRELFAIRDGGVVLAVQDTEGDAGDELYELKPGTAQLSHLNKELADERCRALGMLKDGRLCLHCWNPRSPSESSFRAFDGTSLIELAQPAPEDELGTSWHTLFVAQNGDWWLGGDKGTACYSQERWRLFVSPDKSMPENVTSFAELTDGRIWCAARDQVWEFDGRNWGIVRRGLDRVNALVRTRDGAVWAASNSGLFRYLQVAWIENGTEEGLPSSAVRGLFEDIRGRLWAGTSHGLTVFHPEADPDPPQTSAQFFPGQDSTIPEGATISISFSGQDKWKYTPRERLLFSYRLDVRDWTPFQEASRVWFSDLPIGKHYFQVKAMDRNGNIDPHPASREFAVIGPWYRETRLLLIACCGAVAALFFAGVAFNRHLRLSRSYAEVEKKVAERTQQLEVANRELVHSQKMNALGTLAAGIAHDFNNILSIIKGSTQIIEENLDNPDKIRTRTDRIKLVVEQGAGIVKAMLGFSRDTGREPALCNLNDVVEDTLKLLGDRFLREVEVAFEPGASLPSVLAAKDFIQQILLNFIFNAAESMTERKHILLATKEISALPSDLVLTPVPAVRYIGVSVKDNGCGISPEVLPRIFEPFFTTKALSSRRGTGLGLSMAYELARKIGAGLHVESTVGVGSVFTLILPVRDFASTPPA